MAAKRHIRDLNAKYRHNYSWTWAEATAALNAYRTAKHDALTYEELHEAEHIGLSITKYLRACWKQHVPFETRGVRIPPHGEMFLFGQEPYDFPSSRKG